MWTRMAQAGGVLLLGIAIGQTAPALVGSEAAAAQPKPSGASAAQAGSPDKANAEKTVWYFYKVKWGKQDEFLDLFQKNHYPILKAQIGDRLAGVKTYAPTYHGDGRADWTFAVAITFKDAAALVAPSQEAEIARKLFKDQDTFREEERDRFELLDAHWDVPLNEIDFETRRPTRR